jgi:hypothetical protein
MLPDNSRKGTDVRGRLDRRLVKRSAASEKAEDLLPCC